MIDWSEEDAHKAMLEGWNIYECHGSDNGFFQICVIEEPCLIEWLPFDEKKFNDDTDVWLYVMDKSLGGSPLHTRAIEFIKQENPMEYKAMESWSREYYKIN